MELKAKDTLNEDEIGYALKYVIKDGLATKIMTTLTGGSLLVAFALKLGASNSLVGLLAAISSLAQLLQIPSIYIVEKYKVRKAISFYASLTSRLSWFLISLIPFLFPESYRFTILILAIILNTSFNAISNCSWNSWMHDLIPQKRLGTFFSKRIRLANVVSIPVLILSGFLIDFMRSNSLNYEYYAYSTLFLLGFLSGIIGVYFISKIPEPPMNSLEDNVGFNKLLSKPLEDENFRRLAIFLSSWNFAVNLAAPFFTVYMFKALNLDMFLVTFLISLSQMMNILFLQIWGKFSDHFSNKSVLSICAPILIVSIFSWTFTTLPERHLLTLPLLIIIHIIMGMSTAGVTVATRNIVLKLTPKGYSTSYLASINVINSIASGISPILGGLLADFFSDSELSFTISWIGLGGELSFQTLNFRHWDFLFLISSIIGLYSIHRLALVKEVGEVKREIVIQELVLEMRRGIRTLSTVGGLEKIVNLPPFHIALKNHFKIGGIRFVGRRKRIKLKNIPKIHDLDGKSLNKQEITTS
ncbi:MAG: MFS transporter [Candidatus Asgardarchaeia archaeon]